MTMNILKYMKHLSPIAVVKVHLRERVKK